MTHGPAKERVRLARRLGLMAEAIVTAKVRVTRIEHSDELVQLLREAEKFILEER